MPQALLPVVRAKSAGLAPAMLITMPVSAAPPVLERVACIAELVVATV